MVALFRLVALLLFGVALVSALPLPASPPRSPSRSPSLPAAPPPSPPEPARRFPLKRPHSEGGDLTNEVAAPDPKRLKVTPNKPGSEAGSGSPGRSGPSTSGARPMSISPPPSTFPTSSGDGMKDSLPSRFGSASPGQVSSPPPSPQSSQSEFSTTSSRSPVIPTSEPPQ